MTEPLEPQSGAGRSETAPAERGAGSTTGPSRSPFARIVRGSTNYGLGGMLPQVISFLLVPVYTRFLTPGDYGAADVVGALGAVLVILFRLGITGAVIRFFFDHREGEALSRYISTVAWFLVAWTALAAALLTLAGPLVFAHVAPGVAFLPLGLLGIWTAALGVLPDLQRRLLQAMERSKDHLWLTLLEFLVTVSFTLIFVVGMRLGVLGVLAAPFLASVVMTAVSVGFLRRYWRRVVDRAMLRESFRYGAPMLPHHLSSWLMSLANRLFLNGFTTTEAVGLFGIASRFSSPLNVIFSAVSAAWVPAYFALRKEETVQGRDQAGRLVEQLAVVIVGGSLGLALFGRDLIPLITPDAYHEAGGLVPVLALSGLLRGFYLLVVAEIFFSKRTWWVTLATAVGAVSSVLGSLLMVPRWGATGSAWSMVLSNALVLFIVLLVSRRLHRSAARLPALLGALGIGVVAMAFGNLTPVSEPLSRIGIDILAVAIFALAAVGTGLVRRDDLAHLFAR